MKKLISALLITTMLLTLTACNNEITVPEQLADFEPIPVPESGWTSELAASVFYINGEPIPYPLTVDSLGEGYYLNEKETRFERTTDCVDSVLYYGKTALFNLNYRDYDMYWGFDELPSAKAFSIYTCRDKGDKVNKKLASMLFFNGITLGATKDEVRAIFGEPDDIDPITGEIWEYFYKRTENFGCIFFRFNDDDKLYCIGLTYHTDEDIEQGALQEEVWKQSVRESIGSIWKGLNTVKFPCTFGELSVLGLEADSVVFNEAYRTAEVEFYSGRYPAGSAVLADCAKGETDLGSKKVTRLQLNIEPISELDFYCAVFGHGVTPEELTEILGEPEIAGVYKYPMYNVENAFVEFGFDETLKSLTFTFDS
ncbi:MAG: hypothetical protein J1F09_00775 [Oscillospiraceae bacterium]|nr:hypothetical protein [Oscillospiraceae bacterium]